MWQNFKYFLDIKNEIIRFRLMFINGDELLTGFV